MSDYRFRVYAACAFITVLVIALAVTFGIGGEVQQP